MATKPMTWQEQGPVDSLDEWVSEFWVQVEEGATLSPKCPLQDKRAPMAEPEEDIDVLEPGVKTLQENQTVSIIQMVNATKVGSQESTSISQCTPGDTQEAVTESEQLSGSLQTQEEPEEPGDICEDAFPPPPSLSALSAGEYCETEAFSSLEGEVAEWISDVEVISDPTEDLTSLDSQNSQEWPNAPHLIEPVDQEVDMMSEEMTGDNVTAEENDTQLSVSPDGISNSKTGNNLSQPAHHSLSDSNNSDDVNTVSSPPFADESEEEEEVSVDVVSCHQQWKTLDISSEAFQTSYSACVSVSTNHACPSAKRQEELLPQSQRELAPKGANQEAAQQVFGQGSPPLSTVAMELSNQGGAGAQGCGCVVAVRERCSRAGERTEEGNEQTGGEDGQKETGVERSKPAGQQHGAGLLGYSQTVLLKTGKQSRVSLKHSRHTRMENDSGDDSQSDSGVSADFSPCSTLDGTTTICTGTPASISKETPIEREIRRAIEREHSLRRSRGLPNPPTSPEYVEIPLRKSVLCQSVTAKSGRDQDKDRQFAGKMMQHEIHEEAQREQDLVKLGKVPGFYDKGTVRQIKEKKQLFEAFQTPSDSTISARSKAPSWSSASDVSTLENQEDISSKASTIRGERRRSSDLLSPTQSPNSVKGGGLSDSTPRGPGFPEGTGCQVIIIENNLSVPAQKLYHVKPEAETPGNPHSSSSRTGGHDGLREGEQERKEEEEEDVAPKENPFFKLRSSTNLVKVKQDIQEAQEREKELRKQRISLYGGSRGAKGGEGEGGGGKGGRGRRVSMEGKSPMLSPSVNGLTVPDIPGSSSKVGTGPSAARQSVGKSCVWPPAQAEEEKINRPEVLQSPRTPRQKTPLVQRWESGLVNGHNNEDD